MISALTNHVWQSTLFALAAGVLAAAFRKNRAKVRYWLWFSASLKFFVPFWLLMVLGTGLKWAPAARQTATPAVAFAVAQISEPFAVTAPRAPSPRGAPDWIAGMMLVVWTSGFAGVALTRLRGWLRVRAAVRASSAMEVPAAIEVRTSPGLLEPGVVGWIRPILLLPAGIAERLTPQQLEAVLAHEACHVRRRDNLTSAIHMIVEAVFWFHPLVWWIGARLMEERERACDEEVLRIGGAPEIYAGAILQVCQHYLESPLVCVSGISGSDLKKRIHAILAGRAASDLNLSRKAVLAMAAAAALAAPVVVGILRAPAARAQSQAPAASAPAVAPPVVPQPAIPQTVAPKPVAPHPAAVRLEDPHDRLAYAKEKFGSTVAGMGRIYVQYGAPDQIDDRSGDAQNPSQIWRYNYLEDFRSNVEFEFPKGSPATVRINWPLPLATYEGKPSEAETLSTAFNSELRGETVIPTTTAGLPGRHSSFLIYPTMNGAVLSVPLDGLSGRVDLIGRIRMRPDPGHTTPNPAGVQDSVDASTGTYQATFTLKAGSYTCQLLVRERATGRMYTEVIDFEVK